MEMQALIPALSRQSRQSSCGSKNSNKENVFIFEDINFFLKSVEFQKVHRQKIKRLSPNLLIWSQSSIKLKTQAREIQQQNREKTGFKQVQTAMLNGVRWSFTTLTIRIPTFNNFYSGFVSYAL